MCSWVIFPRGVPDKTRCEDVEGLNCSGESQGVGMCQKCEASAEGNRTVVKFIL